MATVGGNLFAEQPYGDLAVCLVALDATVTIVNAKSKRSAPVEEIIKKGLKAGELVTQISFAIPKPGTFKYAKASAAGAQFRLHRNGGRCHSAGQRRGCGLPHRARRRCGKAGSRQVG